MPTPTPKNTQPEKEYPILKKISLVLYMFSFLLGTMLIIWQIGFVNSSGVKLIINILGYVSFLSVIAGILFRTKYYYDLKKLTIKRIIYDSLVLLAYVIYYYLMLFVFIALGIGA